jgi:hypothetical protein
MNSINKSGNVPPTQPGHSGGKRREKMRDKNSGH